MFKTADEPALEIETLHGCIALWHAKACCAEASNDETRYCSPCKCVANSIRAETIEEMRR